MLSLINLLCTYEAYFVVVANDVMTRLQSRIRLLIFID